MTTKEFRQKLKEMDWNYIAKRESTYIQGLAIVYKNKQEVEKQTMLCDELNELIDEYVNTPIEER